MISLKEYLQASDKDKKKMEDSVRKQIEKESSSKKIEKELLNSKEFKSLLKKYCDLTHKEYFVNIPAKLIFHVDMYVEQGKLVLTGTDFDKNIDTFEFVEKSKSFKDIQNKAKTLHKQSQVLMKKFNIDADEFFSILDSEIIKVYK